MTTNTPKLAPTLVSRLREAVKASAQDVLRDAVTRAFGKDFHISPKDSVRLAGCVVFWFEQDGFKHFMTMQSPETGAQNNGAPKGDGMCRFPSFFGLIPTKDAAETIRTAIQAQLGGAFFKSLDPRLLEADRIAAAPTYRWQDASLGTTDPVQLLVWVIRITPDQAKMAVGGMNMVVTTVPEFSMHGKRISQAHKLIFNTIQRHLGGSETVAKTASKFIKRLADLFEAEDSLNRTIH
ncbi:MAG: hypothetical protein WAX89_05355 [Alphaproteobacteria bacterium]